MKEMNVWRVFGLIIFISGSSGSVGAQQTLDCEELVTCAQLAVEIAATSQQAIGELNSEVLELRETIAELEDEIDTLRTEQNGDIGSNRSDIRGIKDELSSYVEYDDWIKLKVNSDRNWYVRARKRNRVEESVIVESEDGAQDMLQIKKAR